MNNLGNESSAQTWKYIIIKTEQTRCQGYICERDRPKDGVADDLTSSEASSEFSSQIQKRCGDHAGALTG